MTLSDFIRSLAPMLKPTAIAATCDAAEQVRTTLVTYPPETIANSPNNPRGRWYERGYGTRWKSGGRPTSEHLGRSWTVTQRQNDVIVQNSASYAPMVQGHFQTTVHQRIGWLTVTKAVSRIGSTFQREIGQQMRVALDALKRG